MNNSFLKSERPLHSLTQKEFDDLKNSGMLWELYPEAPEFHWQAVIMGNMLLGGEIDLNKSRRSDKSIFLSNLHYFFAQTDGTYKYPDGAIGDLLKQAKKEIEQLLQEN